MLPVGLRFSIDMHISNLLQLRTWHLSLEMDPDHFQLTQLEAHDVHVTVDIQLLNHAIAIGFKLIDQSNIMQRMRMQSSNSDIK